MTSTHHTWGQPYYNRGLAEGKRRAAGQPASTSVPDSTWAKALFSQGLTDGLECAIPGRSAITTMLGNQLALAVEDQIALAHAASASFARFAYAVAAGERPHAPSFGEKMAAAVARVEACGEAYKLAQRADAMAI